MKFTVAIPAFKTKYLKECIESVLRQSYADYEFIIVNDASPYDVGGVVNMFPDAPIKYLVNPVNRGAEHVVDNWNTCLSMARGDYFLLLGDDDELERNYLQVFSDLIDKNPHADVFHCRTKIIDGEGRVTRITEGRPGFETVYEAIWARMINNRLFFISDHVFRTEKLRENGGFYKLPLAWASDDISAYMAANPNGLVHTNEPVFRYRMSPVTLSSSGSLQLKMEAIVAQEKWLRDFTKTTPSGELDKVVWNNIVSETGMYFSRMKVRTLSCDKSMSWRHLWKWFGKRQEYGLSTAEMVYAGISFLKEKRKKGHGIQ